MGYLKKIPSVRAQRTGNRQELAEGVFGATRRFQPRWDWMVCTT